jgi:hypothetical protein
LDGIVDVLVRIKTGTTFKRKHRLVAASEEYNLGQDRRRLINNHPPTTEMIMGFGKSLQTLTTPGMFLVHKLEQDWSCTIRIQ